MKPTRFIDSVNCAIEGILYTARTQKHMRRHFVAAMVLLVFVLAMNIIATVIRSRARARRQW